jgi:two-component system KDP operon response regulator KdpE
VGPRILVRVVDRGPRRRRRREGAHLRALLPGARRGCDNGHRGSGLGLAIVRGFVEANGGRVWVESLPGQGATFVVELPLEQPRQDARAASCVVDDERQILRALKVILREAGYEVIEAVTMEEALDQRGRAPPDAAIVDLMLPDGSGVELCRRLREWSSMPIIVLSAIGEEEAKVEALEAGADDYVTKPFGPRELVARLAAALRRVGDAPGEPAVEVDGLVVDLNARAVRRDGEEIHLTPIEFDLLRTLVRHRGRLMTHRALLVEVWGPQYADDTRSCAPTSPTCAARSSRPASAATSAPIRASATASPASRSGPRVGAALAERRGRGTEDVGRCRPRRRRRSPARTATRLHQSHLMYRPGHGRESPPAFLRSRGIRSVGSC